MKLTNEQIKEKLLPKGGIVDVVIDTDAFNEVDDQFAIAWALKSPERMNVQAIYAAPFSREANMVWHVDKRAISAEMGMIDSYDEILNVMNIMDMNDACPVFKGSRHFLIEVLQENGIEEVQDLYDNCKVQALLQNEDVVNKLKSEAVEDLIKRGMEAVEPLYVLALGAISNVAIALLLEPKLAEKIVVVWLGGQPHDFPSALGYNLKQDSAGVNVLLDSRVPLIQMPAFTVTSSLTVSSADLKQNLMGKSPIGTYLSEIVIDKLDKKQEPTTGDRLRYGAVAKLDEIDIEYFKQFITTEKSWTRIIWDISVVAYVLNPSWCFVSTVEAPKLNSDLTWKKVENRHPIYECRYLHRDLIFGDMYAKLTK